MPPHSQPVYPTHQAGYGEYAGHAFGFGQLRPDAPYAACDVHCPACGSIYRQQMPPITRERDPFAVNVLAAQASHNFLEPSTSNAQPAQSQVDTYNWVSGELARELDDLLVYMTIQDIASLQEIAVLQRITAFLETMENSRVPHENQ